MDNNGFINHGMDNLMETRAGRLGGGGKAVSQLSVTSRAYLQNGGVSYRHEAPMLNDKYFPKVVQIRYLHAHNNLWGQPIKLIQVVSTSEFHEY